MKIFLSSLSTDVLTSLNVIDPGLKPNVLLTYYQLARPMDYINRCRHMIGGLVLDSGAFSLNNLFPDLLMRAKESNKLFEDYKYDLVLIQKYYDFVFNFDDDFGPSSFEHNLSRLCALEARGTKPVPVVHNLANHEVSYYIDKGYTMVAIGQCLAQNRNELDVLWPVVERLYQAGIKVHLFGMTTPGIIEHVPAYSCDSKTWLDYGTRGRVLYWNQESSKLDKTEIIHIPRDEVRSSKDQGVYYRDYKYFDAFLDHIERRLGLKKRDLLGIQNERIFALINVLYFLEMEKRITNIQENMGTTF